MAGDGEEGGKDGETVGEDKEDVEGDHGLLRFSLREDVRRG